MGSPLLHQAGVQAVQDGVEQRAGHGVGINALGNQVRVGGGVLRGQGIHLRLRQGARGGVGYLHIRQQALQLGRRHIGAGECQRERGLDALQIHDVIRVVLHDVGRRQRGGGLQHTRADGDDGGIHDLVCGRDYGHRAGNGVGG